MFLYLQIVFAVVLIINGNTVLESIASNKFTMVSTTHSPTSGAHKKSCEKCGKRNYRLEKIENQLVEIQEARQNELKGFEEVVKKLIQANDEQITKILESLENYKKLYKEVERNLLAKAQQITEIEKKLKEEKRRNIQNFHDKDRQITTIQETLQNTKTLNEEINRKFEQKDTQIAKIEETLENEKKINEEFELNLQSKDQRISRIQKSLEVGKEFTEHINMQLYSRNEQIDKIYNTLENYSSKNEKLPKNCKEVMERGNHLTGIYLIRPKSQTFMVKCDMNTQGGGWTVFHNRFDGSQDFYLNWLDYKRGFGNLLGEFWLGLELLHQLTNDDDNELYVELTDKQKVKGYATYRKFGVGSEQEEYPLKTLGGYHGNAGDSMSNQFRMKFSTRDRDQDASEDKHCAQRYTGAWWYNECHWSNLNGKYLKGSDKYSVMCWGTFSDGSSLIEAKMMVRPR